MVEVNCIKIRDYKPFKAFGYNISNIWKGYDEDNEDEIFMWFDIEGKGISRNQTFSRSTTLQDLKRFIKYFEVA